MDWILSNVRTILIAAAVTVLSSAVSAGVGYFKGKHECAIEGQLQTDVIAIDKGEKNAEILANSPDDARFVDGVLPAGAY